MLGIQTCYEYMTGRSWKWAKVRDEHLAANPTCVVCGRVATTVHHVRPVHIAPALELDPTNFASVCDDDHWTVGHVRNWQRWNDNFWQVANLIRKGVRGPVGDAE